ncbi:helix-turn-helix transcriptional regulator [Tabrizicola thermarum]|uniref:helix-turn-helix transcriptional regulator n=1 Tax=Tabrizicola thermarum TaxID=2670345 RepID=UPI000FFB0F33|nr:AlpA family transcriptional regulator [Tabrizicola thermarum]
MNALTNTPTDPGTPDRALTAAQLVPNALLRTPDVCAVTGMARPTLYEAMAKGLFPRPIKLGEKSSAWPASECNAVLAARIRGATEDEIRALVVELTAARKHRI